MRKNIISTLSVFTLLLIPLNTNASTTSIFNPRGSLVTMIITSFSLIFLLLTLYFLSRSLKTFGGKIGNSLNFIGLGIFGIALKELFIFLEIFFNLNTLIAKEEAAQNTVSLVVFIFFAYGFYSLGKILGIGKTKEK